jgi:hypothetical protein
VVLGDDHQRSDWSVAGLHSHCVGEGACQVIVIGDPVLVLDSDHPALCIGGN